MIVSAVLALAMGFAFGWLLHLARVDDGNVIEGQFCLRDFTMLKVMLPAILIGGLGVLALTRLGEAHYYVKDANLLAVGLGAAIFGVALVVLGYCPGTALAAAGAGSAHALVGVVGMVFGAIVYAMAYDWLKAWILPVWAFGKIRLPDVGGLPDLAWFAAIAAGAALLFVFIETRRNNER